MVMCGLELVFFAGPLYDTYLSGHPVRQLIIVLISGIHGSVRRQVAERVSLLTQPLYSKVLYRFPREIRIRYGKSADFL